MAMGGSHSSKAASRKAMRRSPSRGRTGPALSNLNQARHGRLQPPQGFRESREGSGSVSAHGRVDFRATMQPREFGADTLTPR